MASHLHFRVGYWEDALAYNIRAVETSRLWSQWNLATAVENDDWHSMMFVHYINLQLGRGVSTPQHAGGQALRVGSLMAVLYSLCRTLLNALQNWFD
jgi:hypothetical protein